MNASPIPDTGFKRQVVFRVGAEDWALLRSAAEQHGAIQAALIAGVRALTAQTPSGSSELRAAAPEPAPTQIERAPDPEADVPVDEELTARQAAELLGLKPSTVRGYIRSGRLQGRYDEGPPWTGWVTTRAAVEGYRN